MGRKQEGTVVERPTKKGTTYALRFIAYGEREYLTLGNSRDGYTREQADTELANIMADVRRGIWVPPPKEDKPPAVEGDTALPTFGAFARKRLVARALEVDTRTYEHDEWALRVHLLPYFEDWPLDEIKTESVDEYRAYKLAQADQRREAIEDGQPLRDDNGRVLRPLARSSINRTITVLAAYLGIAVDYYDELKTNVAEGKRRRLKVRASRPVHLDTAAQIIAVLDAAGILDASPRWQINDRRPIVATLLLAGPRAHELAHLLWRDVDLANGRIFIGRSKTVAGLREIPMQPLLQAILTTYKASREHTGPDDLVFPTNRRGLRNKDNIRYRILRPVLALADELLLARQEVPLPKGVTPHKLRHTFASILVACGEDHASVMAQLGHTDSRFTLNVYTHLMRRDPAERQRLKDCVNNVRIRDTLSPAEAGPASSADPELIAA